MIQTDKMPRSAWEIEIAERRSEADRVARLEQELYAAHNIIRGWRFSRNRDDFDIQVVDAWLERNRGYGGK